MFHLTRSVGATRYSALLSAGLLSPSSFNTFRSRQAELHSYCRYHEGWRPCTFCAHFCASTLRAKQTQQQQANPLPDATLSLSGCLSLQHCALHVRVMWCIYYFSLHKVIAPLLTSHTCSYRTPLRVCAIRAS